MSKIFSLSDILVLTRNSSEPLVFCSGQKKLIGFFNLIFMRFPSMDRTVP